MKLRSIAILFAFAVASAAAHAQGGVYGTFSAQQFTRTGLVSNPPAGSSNSDSPWLYGPTVGAYYTLTHIPKLGEVKTGPVAIGFDFRGDFLHGSRYDRADGLIGLRLTPKKLVLGVTPYLQGSAGIGHTKLPNAFYYTNNWSFQFAVGADRKLKGHLDWRVIEASAGFLADFVAGTAPNNSNYMVTLGTGLAYRLGGK